MKVKEDGPLIDGKVEDIAKDWETAWELAMGEEGVSAVRRELHRVLQHPTGRYESRIVAVKDTKTTTLSDQNAVQGTWLEGTSRRNSSSRFKGYQTFAKVEALLQQRAADIAQDLAGIYVGRMNGK